MNRIVVGGVILAAALFLQACTTKEFRQARQECEIRWMSELPPDFVDEERIGVEQVEVPDGSTVCDTFELEDGTVRTVCRDGTAVVDREYTYIVQVDKNEAERDLRIGTCAAEQCLATYGNADCEVK